MVLLSNQICINIYSDSGGLVELYASNHHRINCQMNTVICNSIYFSYSQHKSIHCQCICETDGANDDQTNSNDEEEQETINRT